jgi:hypothetical protein
VQFLLFIKTSVFEAYHRRLSRRLAVSGGCIQIGREAGRWVWGVRHRWYGHFNLGAWVTLLDPVESIHLDGRRLNGASV